MLLLLKSTYTWYAAMQAREKIDASAGFNSKLVTVLIMPGNCCAARAGVARRVQAETENR